MTGQEWLAEFAAQLTRTARCTPRSSTATCGTSSSLTRLDDDDQLWVGVLTFSGDHTTAGLDMTLFFGPDVVTAMGNAMYMAPGEQVGRAVEIGRQIATNAPPALRHTIANARLAVEAGEPAAIEAIPAMSAAVRGSADFREGIASFIERRTATFTGT